MTKEYPLDDKRFSEDDGFRVKAGSINVEKRTLRATVSTDMVDRDGEIVAPTAFKGRIKTYLANPILLWNHDHFSVPIGRATDLQFHEKSVEAEFFFRPDDPLAESVWGAYRYDVLSSFSVGFKTFKDEEIRTAEGKSVRKIVDAELYEISAVPMPSNTEATKKHAAMVDTIKRALFADAKEEKTLYAPAPSRLDVWRRCAVLAKESLEGLRENKSIPAAERAAMEQVDLALRALLTSPTSDVEAKAQEELNAILAMFRKAS